MKGLKLNDSSKEEVRTDCFLALRLKNENHLGWLLCEHLSTAVHKPKQNITQLHVLLQPLRSL
ncbi:hypothetical protein L484_019023 [Morus notabilis]|uniref:Uncharacterized protein n=1 Tax=Morus notabilis TaxID=981085 RepID=W9R255_9ROSA|nr:hypothetical protein L484_019023 [Morus notabilis]